jgi:hypothetical protein
VSGIEQVCKQAHILNMIGKKKIEEECYKKMAITKCQWIPGNYQEAGYYIKEEKI